MAKILNIADSRSLYIEKISKISSYPQFADLYNELIKNFKKALASGDLNAALEFCDEAEQLNMWGLVAKMMTETSYGKGEMLYDKVISFFKNGKSEEIYGQIRSILQSYSEEIADWSPQYALWISSNASNTCDECAEKHLKLYKIDEISQDDFHPNCACDIIYLKTDGSIETAKAISNAVEVVEKKQRNVLDNISDLLTVASLIPGLDTFTNLASIPVDLARGDFVSAGLSTVGMVPVVAEVADTVKLAKIADKAVDAAKVAKTAKSGKSIIKATKKSSALKSVDKLPSNIQKSAKSFFKGSSNNYNSYCVIKNKNNTYTIKMENPGKVPGSKAVYNKIVDSNGKTIKVYKDTFDPLGNLVHRKDK